MKTAICFFGLPRNFKENKVLFDRMSEFDVFCHFWAQDDKISEEIKDSLKCKTFYLEPAVDTRFHAYSDIVGPENSIEFLRHKLARSGINGFGDPIEHPGFWKVNPKNIVSMWNSMSKSVSLALSHSCNMNFNYDRIVLMRSDITLSDNFDLNATFVGDVHKFLMPHYHPGSRIRFWIPDHIISMSLRAARAITFLPQFSYHHYYVQKAPIIPEVMLGHHMATQCMNIQTSGLYYKRDYMFYGDIWDV